MKCKAKRVAVTSMSFMLLGMLQIATATAATELVVKPVVFELTDGNMDDVTAGKGSALASSYASATGGSVITSVITSTGANPSITYALGTAVAASCCNGGETSTRVNVSTNGDRVRTYSGHQEGSNSSARWATSYSVTK
jgi:hypothetical protein